METRDKKMQGTIVRFPPIKRVVRHTEPVRVSSDEKQPKKRSKMKHKPFEGYRQGIEALGGDPHSEHPSC